MWYKLIHRQKGHLALHRRRLGAEIRFRYHFWLEVGIIVIFKIMRHRGEIDVFGNWALVILIHYYKKNYI